MPPFNVREARESDAEAMGQVLIESRRWAHRDHIPAESLMRFTAEESARNWARTLRQLAETPNSDSCIFVGETADGQVVGVAMAGPERTKHPTYPGEVYILYILPEYHRQGLGRRLLQAMVAHLIGHGMPAFLIRVLKANMPARRFYEALGGRLVLEEQIEEDGAVLDQAAYGWSDAGSLLRET
jgi:ribosomal protein S18 acetylase RimI-like enzyme